MSLLRIPGAGRVAVGVSDGGVRIFATGVGATGPWVPLLTLRATFSTVGWMSVARDGTALVALPDNGQFLRWQVPAVVR